MKRMFMRRAFSIALAILSLPLFFGSCKTKEKVAERLSETARSNSSSVVMTSQQVAQEGQASMTEEATETFWSDSIVERFHERIVTDSCGRVLLHDTEVVQDHYKGKAGSRTQRNGNSRGTAVGQKTTQMRGHNDSIYTAQRHNEVRTVEKKPWRWLWLIGLLGSLLVVGIIISKATRR